MNNEYIQSLRYKLQRRVRSLNSAESAIFYYKLQQFWTFLQSYLVFKSCLDMLEIEYDYINPKIEEFLKHEYRTEAMQSLDFKNELEHVAFSYFYIKHILFKMKGSADNIVHSIMFTLEKENPDEGCNCFVEFFVEPLYDYLDEQMDDNKAILAFLQKYKRKCEWFHRQRLYELWENETQKGENILAQDLYEYLFDQGIEFVIEPSSVSGEVDFIASQTSEQKLIADAKIFNPDKSKGKSYIASGFNQIYQYALDYNEPLGYLIIFNTSDKRLSFSLTNQNQETQFVIHNNKIIFLLCIDIYPDFPSASKRGNLETIEITEKDLICQLAEMTETC